MRRVPLHPLLLAAFPVVFLFTQNAERVQTRKIVLPLIVVLGIAALVTAVATLLMKDVRRGAIVGSGLVILALSYGHIAAVVIRRDVVLVPLWGLLAVAVVVAAVRASALPEITGILNAVAATLVIVSFIGAMGAVSSRAGGAQTRAGEQAEQPPTPSGEGTERDIYYLIFDRYGSQPVLEEHLGFDNSVFVSDLRERGFYVADESDSNYPTTAHSLASSMNMTYLDALAEREGASSKDWGPLYEQIVAPKIVRFLKDRGYRYAHIGPWYDPTAHDPTAHVNYHYDKRSEFTRVLISTTVVAPFAERLGFLEALDGRRVAHNQIRFQFDSIVEASKLDGPTFTFAHILLPHEPMTFDANGAYVPEEPTDAASWDRAFLEQTRYANKRIIDLVDHLLAGPDDADPIVILQSDEGPKSFDALKYGVEERWLKASDGTLNLKFGILNAYYLPGEGEGTKLYPSITPVNSFRALFNAYFETDLALLDDEMFVYGNDKEPYDLTNVTRRVR